MGKLLKIKYIPTKKGEYGKYKKDLLQIEYECFGHEERLTDYEFKKFIDKSDSFCWVAFNGKNVVGYILGLELEKSGKELENDENFGKNNTLYIYSIAVLPFYQSKGIGKSLMKKFIKMLPKKYTRITLNTDNIMFKILCMKLGFNIEGKFMISTRIKEYFVKRFVK